jgi:hypothetical protein
MSHKYCLLVTFILFLFGCRAPRHPLSPTINPISDYLPKTIMYDTISGDFFYENLINSYIEVDAVVKSSGFIQADTLSEAAYKRGYFINGYSYNNLILSKGIDIRVDKMSIANFYDSQFQKAISEGTMRETSINPFCGAYYKKYEMKIEVIFIDSVDQRVPLFMDCKQYTSSEGSNRKNYSIMKLPTYAITKIFFWREL